MPVELWGEAVCLARKRGVSSISQALGVGFRVLQKRVDLAAAVNHAGAAAGTNGFVELKLAPPVESCVASGAVLELSRADGARLELRFPAHEPVDVLGLVAAFVGRGA